MSENVTVSIKVSPSTKIYINDTLNEVPEKYPDVHNKGEAIKQVFDIYNNKILRVQSKKYLDSEIQNALNIINCQYLKYEGDANGFMCNEFLFKKKKGDSIGFDPEHVIVRCNDCRLGKQEQKELAYEKILQKDSIKKMIDLRKTLLTMIGKGFDIQAWMCKGDFYEQDAVYFSKDGLHLPCPITDDTKERLALVSISEVCKEAMNPNTFNPPCQHLINLSHKVFIPDFEDIINETENVIELQQLEQKPKTKIIDVESSIIEPDTKEE